MRQFIISAILGVIKKEKIMDQKEILKALGKLASLFTDPEVVEITHASQNRSQAVHPTIDKDQHEGGADK